MGWHGTVNVTKPYDIISLTCTYMCTHFDAAWLATEVKMSPTVCQNGSFNRMRVEPVSFTKTGPGLRFLEFTWNPT